MYISKEKLFSIINDLDEIRSSYLYEIDSLEFRSITKVIDILENTIEKIENCVN